MKEIVLTKGFVTKVDDDDHEWLSAYKWHAHERGKEAGRRRLSPHTVARTALRIDLGDGRVAYQNEAMHRMIMDAKPGEYVDHINGDPLDNRKENLRIVTNQQNSWNACGAKSINGKPTSSGFKGVFKKTCKTPYGEYEYYVARVRANGRDITVYHGKDEVAAACHYDMAAKHYFGEYARLNFDGAAYDKWYNSLAS